MKSTFERMLSAPVTEHKLKWHFGAKEEFEEVVGRCSAGRIKMGWKGAL